MEKARLMGIHRAQFPENQWRAIGEEYYEWKVFKNPAMVGDIYLEMRDGRSVGSSTVMPKKIAIMDKIVMAAEWADNFTVPEYRKQGINIKAVTATKDYVISHGMDLIYGVPNEVNYPTYLKLGCKPCEYIGWTFLTKSLNPLWLLSKLIVKIMLGKQVQKNFRHLKHLHKRLTTNKQSWQSWHNSGKHDFTIITINRFNNEIDPLWGKPRYSFFVYRDKEYLNWRYFDNPDTFIVLAAVTGRDYLGHVVLKLSTDKRIGILCDFVTIDDRSDVFLALVGESEKILRQNGVNSIQLRCIVDSPYYRDLNTLGYYDPGRESYSRVVIYAKTEIGKRILENPGRWHFTFGDTDEV
jgi:hypothetical protein